MLLHRDTREFLVRAWGRTLSRGRIGAGGAAELAEVCRKTLGGATLCCPGNPDGPGPGGGPGGGDGLTPVSHPFRRWVSKDCQVLHEEEEEEGGSSAASDQGPNSIEIFWLGKWPEFFLATGSLN